MTEVCGNCRHRVIVGTNPMQVGVEQAQCRRFPPFMVMVGVGQGSLQYPPVPKQFPACAEFKAKPNLATANNGGDAIEEA